LSPAGTVRTRSKSKSTSKTTRTKTASHSKSRGSAKARTAARGEETYNGIGSAAVAAKTGKGWQDWFAILDRAKANT